MKNTSDMQNELLSSPDLERFLSEKAEDFQDSFFTEYLSQLIEASGLSKSELSRRSAMSEVYLYQILTSVRHPSRNRVLSVAIGLKASLDEVKKLLELSGHAPLYVKNRRDAILIYGISHNESLQTINNNLFNAGEKTIC